jgi:alpha-D-ribose 1-methylphosphonate 5-phosphate C-P lyase
MKFTFTNSKHTKPVKFSGAGVKKNVRRSYPYNSKKMLKLSDHDVHLQEYRIVDIFNNPIYVY